MDLLNPSAKYELLIDNIPRLFYPTGGLLQKTPILCSGHKIVSGMIYDHETGIWNFKKDQNDVSQDCIVIGNPAMDMKMLEIRSNPASVALQGESVQTVIIELSSIIKLYNDVFLMYPVDQNTLWIVGGSRNNELDCEDTTEFIKLGQPSAKGPDMPFSISCHTIIQHDEKSIYIIGGEQNDEISRNTWIADPTNGFRIQEGPPLNVARSHHGCAKMTINGKTLLVVAGGTESDKGPLCNSVEILDPSTKKEWTLGLQFKSIYQIL